MQVALESGDRATHRQDNNFDIFRANAGRDLSKWH